VGEPARRGLGGERQEDPAPLAGRGPARTGEAAQAATPRQLDNAAARGCGQSVPIRCGRSTSSSTRLRNGRILKLLHVVDKHTREALAVEGARRIDSDHTASVLERIVAHRGAHPSSCGWTTGPS